MDHMIYWKALAV